MRGAVSGERRKRVRKKKMVGAGKSEKRRVEWKVQGTKFKRRKRRWKKDTRVRSTVQDSQNIERKKRSGKSKLWG